jgi:hypothetical protein
MASFDPEPEPARRWRFLVVGGNEKQARYDQAIQAHFAEKGAGVDVEFCHPTREDKGRTLLDYLVARAAHCDGVVLIRFLRTHLGRGLRRRLNRSHTPYFGCAGHGREAIIRAIEAAVDALAGGKGPESCRSQNRDQG